MNSDDTTRTSPTLLRRTADWQGHAAWQEFLADAVIALTSNFAMRQKRRIDFDSRWLDYQSPETPGGSSAVAQRG